MLLLLPAQPLVGGHRLGTAGLRLEPCLDVGPKSVLAAQTLGDGHIGEAEVVLVCGSEAKQRTVLAAKAGVE